MLYFMVTVKKNLPVVLFMGLGLLFLFLIMSCSRGEGKGGRALIVGKVFVRDYNSSGILKGQFYGPDEDVFIIYGDGTFYGDEVKTSYDGTYRFEYLRKGHYRVFAYSDCDTCASGTEPIMLDVDIMESEQVVELPDLVVRR